MSYLSGDAKRGPHPDGAALEEGATSLAPPPWTLHPS